MFFIGLLACAHPETGEFRMLSDSQSRSVCPDARQMGFSSALVSRIKINYKQLVTLMPCFE